MRIEKGKSLKELYHDIGWGEVLDALTLLFLALVKGMVAVAMSLYNIGKGIAMKVYRLIGSMDKKMDRYEKSIDGRMRWEERAFQKEVRKHEKRYI